MVCLLEIPPETLEDVLLHSDPFDIAAFAQTCRLARSLVYYAPDQHLWRALYLAQPFDDPRKCVSHSGRSKSAAGVINWKDDLQRVIRARTVLRKAGVCRPHERCDVLRALLDMVCHVPPLSSTAGVASPSQNLLWVASALSESDFLDSQPDGVSEEERQLHAQLHTYFGLTLSDLSVARRVVSRAYVYDMRHCSSANNYGPFLSDGSLRVNWVHVQAVHHAVSMHIVADYVDAPFPMSMRFTQPIIPTDLDLDRERDWAGLTGVWRCSFCFCNHQELLDFNNESETSSEPLDPTLFWNPDFPEAFRFLDIKIQVTEVSADDANPTRPVIHFSGAVSAAGTIMRGWVRMTPDDQIRWHSVSEEGGVPIWRCEGVQVGGVGSMFGVLGHWTTVLHERDDPIGPFWLHKIV